MKRRRVFLISAALLVMGVFGGFFLSSKGDAGIKRPLDRVSARGVAVDPTSLSARDQAFLSSIGATTDVRLLGEVAQRAFYSAVTGSGANCFLTGPAGDVDAHFASGGCLTTADFPSATTPILDDSSFWSPRPSNGVRIVELRVLSGFAADGVVSVGVIDATGDYVATPVRNNIYREVLAAPVIARELVAKSKDGHVVYRARLARELRRHSS